jgi:hypothetical protein
MLKMALSIKAGERGGGGKIPGARSAQRGPEILVKCSYIVYHRQFPEGQGPVFTNRHFVPGPVVGSRRPCSACYTHKNLTTCQQDVFATGL